MKEGSQVFRYFAAGLKQAPVTHQPTFFSGADLGGTSYFDIISYLQGKKMGKERKEHSFTLRPDSLVHF